MRVQIEGLSGNQSIPEKHTAGSVEGGYHHTVGISRYGFVQMAPMHLSTPLLRAYRGIWPRLGARVYVDPAASVLGDVVLGDDVSIWPMSVVRGDVNYIHIGARSNVQDGAVIHVSHAGPHAKLGGFATVIGEDVTIGHKAVIHACTIKEACLIGMGALILDGVVVNKHALIGAGALVAPGKVIGERELWLGNPARCVRTLSDAEIEGLYYSAAHYVRLKDDYLGDLGDRQEV